MFDNYFLKLQELLDDEEASPQDLASLFRINGLYAQDPNIKACPVPTKNYIKRFVPEPFDTLAQLYLRIIIAAKNDRYYEAFANQVEFLQTFNKELVKKVKEENWFMNICYVSCSNLRHCAKMATRGASRSGQIIIDPDDRSEKPSQEPSDVADFYEKCAGLIMDCYRSCVVDVRASMESTKRVAMLNLTNQLFAIYFKINKLHLLKPLIRAIDNCGELWDLFSMADKITYNFFLGRKLMFDSNFPKAQSCLTFAYRNCHPESLKNQRLILMYLIPVKMFLGHLPTEELLQKHSLTQFSEVAASIRQGNPIRFEAALNANEAFFISCGIFLMLEKLKIIIYRTLFKKICSIMATHQVPLDAFVDAMHFIGETDMDVTEIACILANLIFQGRIKGYLSHQHQKLVISKQNAFPPLSSVTLAA